MVLKHRSVLKYVALGLVLPWVLLGCGGGGSADGSSSGVNKFTGGSPQPGSGVGTNTDLSIWQKGVFPASNNFIGRCETPDLDDLQGTVQEEKMWLRSWTNEDYLWYDEVPDVNPASFTVLDYFDLLVTDELTASGNAKDRFHFYYDKDEWDDYQAGIASGYGVYWDYGYDDNEMPLIRALYVEAGSPADIGGITRGDTLERADGISIAEFQDNYTSFYIFLEALSPTAVAEHTFVVRSVAGVSRSVTMQSSTSIVSSAVFHSSVIETDTGTVGYMVFNTHNLVAQDELIATVEQFVTAGVSDLVLDLRYNGGGLLAVASQLAYMVAGDSTTDGKTFELIKFSDKHPKIDPETNQPIEPFPFLSLAYKDLGNTLHGSPLPTLNLSRVFVLTTGETCSASESIINGLRGVDLDVIQIGGTTCGKPYGFYPRENCGNVYFSVNFKGVNNKGFGDFSEGFTPQNTPGNTGYRIEGCYGDDDLGHALGDKSEGLLSQALEYRNSGQCFPVAASEASGVSEKSDVMIARKAKPVGVVPFLMPREPVHSNKYIMW